MADQTRAPTPSQTTVTVVESEDESQQDVRSVRLKLRKPKARKAVQWESGTVDNEHMNKMKSKCCCIYEKPRAFDESSSSSSEEDCEHCFGHVEKRKKKHAHGSDPTVHEHQCHHDHTHEQDQKDHEHCQHHDHNDHPKEDPQPSKSSNEPSPTQSPDVASNA